MKKTNKPFSATESHSYDVNVAVALKNAGKATLLKEFCRSHRFWERQGKGEHDGFSWFFLRMGSFDKKTPNKKIGLAALYPEYSEKTMYRWIREMEELHLIASRKDLNQHGYDKTRWFTVNLEAYEALAHSDTSVLYDSQNENKGQFSKWAIAILKLGLSNSQNESSNSQNEPTIQSSIKPSIKPSIKKKSNSENELNDIYRHLTEEEQKKFSSNFKKQMELFPVEYLDEEIKKSKGVARDELIKIKEKKIEKEKSAAKKGKANLIDLGAVEIMEHLIEMTGVKYSKNLIGRGSLNVKYVKALLSKKYTVDEIKLMIDFKCWEWIGSDKMQKHLVPVTLFKHHGIEYVEQAIIAKENPAFQAALKKAKKAQNGNKLKITNEEVFNQAKETLKDW